MNIFTTLQNMSWWQILITFWVCAELGIHYLLKSSACGVENETGFHTHDEIIVELELRLSSLRNDYGILVREFQTQKLNNQAIIREYNRILENNDRNNKQLLEVIK